MYIRANVVSGESLKRRKCKTEKQKCMLESHNSISSKLKKGGNKSK